MIGAFTFATTAAVIAVVFVVGTSQVRNFLKLRPVITTSERDPPATASASARDDLVTVVQGLTLVQPSCQCWHLLWDRLGD